VFFVKTDGYSWAYRQARRSLLADGPMCVYCKVKRADTADHVPPLSSFPAPELWQGDLVPCCKGCNSRMGAKIVNDRRRKHKRSREW
jgi:5-methylcytosine-specific restriction endonuclease McrA